MFTVIPSLVLILTKAPRVISIIASIMSVLGSTQVQKILTAIKDAMHDEGTMPNTADEPTRERFVHRILQRMSFKTLGISQEQYAAMQNVYKNAENFSAIA